MDNFQTTLSLVHAAQAGQREAVECLFARYLPRVRRIVALRLGYRRRDLEEYDDLVQEAVLNLFENLESFEEHSEATFRNWVSRCVANSVTEHFRREGAQKRGRGRVVHLGDVEESTLAESIFASQRSPSSLAQAREIDERLEELLLELKEHHREAIILRHLCGMSFEEVAKTMGFESAANARKTHERALAKLRSVAAGAGLSVDG